MANTTVNTPVLIKAQVYSEFMLEAIADGFLPDGLFRNVSDFGDGETLIIPVLGETILRDYVEDTGVEFDPIDSGTVSLTITEYVSAGHYITDKLKQDAYKAAALEAAIPKEHLRLIRTRYETDMLAQANKQTSGSPNLVNGVAHRWIAHSGTTNGVITLEDFAYAKLALDKANIAEVNRVAIVDPSVEMSLNLNVAAQAFTNNPQFEGIVNTGFAKGRRFVRNIFGFDVYVSNHLPVTVASEIINGGPAGTSASLAGGVANIFAAFGDDNVTPFMGAWRQMPATEGFRNATFKRDEYTTTARWGFGLQRAEGLVVIITDPTKYK